MQHYIASDYTPIDRSLILRRSDPRDDLRPVGRLLLDVPGLSIDWALVPDRRDVRRWFAVDAAGVRQAHAAWPSILR